MFHDQVVASLLTALGGQIRRAGLLSQKMIFRFPDSRKAFLRISEMALFAKQRNKRNDPCGFY
jgi:hypothetical protein